MTAWRVIWALAAAAMIPVLPARSAPPTVDVPHAVGVPRMDADPGDAAWEAAAVIPALTLSILPGPERRTALPTRVRLLWDEDNLYVRFVCRDDDIYAPYSRHDDPLYKGEVVEVFLDVRGDGRQYIELQVSPDNVTLDKLFVLTADPVSDARGKLNDEILARDFWEFLEWTLPGLRTAARRVTGPEAGWIVDLAIPAGETLRRLGRAKFEPLSLRANFLRYDWPASGDGKTRSLTALNWAPVVDGCPHLSPQAMGVVRLCPGR